MIDAKKLVRAKTALSWWEEGPRVRENQWIVWIKESDKAVWGKVERSFENEVQGSFLHWVYEGKEKCQEKRWTVFYDCEAMVFRGKRGWIDEFGFDFQSDEHLQIYLLKTLVYHHNSVGSLLSMLKEMNVDFDPITLKVSGIQEDMKKMFESYIMDDMRIDIRNHFKGNHDDGQEDLFWHA